MTRKSADLPDSPEVDVGFCQRLNGLQNHDFAELKGETSGKHEDRKRVKARRASRWSSTYGHSRLHASEYHFSPILL